MEYVTLNNGVKMPQLGYGVYQVTKDECELGIPPEPIILLKSNFFLSQTSIIFSTCAANQPIRAVISTEFEISCCKYDINYLL